MRGGLGGWFLALALLVLDPRNRDIRELDDPLVELGGENWLGVLLVVAEDVEHPDDFVGGGFGVGGGVHFGS